MLPRLSAHRDAVDAVLAAHGVAPQRSFAREPGCALFAKRVDRFLMIGRHPVLADDGDGPDVGVGVEDDLGAEALQLPRAHHRREVPSLGLELHLGTGAVRHQLALEPAVTAATLMSEFATASAAEPASRAPIFSPGKINGCTTDRGDKQRLGITG